VSSWKEIERPGYFGSKREQKHQQFDQEYGSENWRLAWKLGDGYVQRFGMNMLYEDAYYFFLLQNPSVLAQLVAEASDVYDDALTNLGRFDYSDQETDRTHVQDIAIRRSVLRLGEHFRGSEPIQIRDALGEHPLSLTLSPGQIPFHKPSLLVVPQLEGWWLPGSVESFYQSNKYLQIRS